MQQLSTVVFRRGMSHREHDETRNRLCIRFRNCPDYELRGFKERFHNGKWRTVWHAYRVGDRVFELHEINKSTYPDAVAADLSDWLRRVS